MKTKIIVALLILFTTTIDAKKNKPELFSQLNYGQQNTGTLISIRFEKGKEHNHPLFAIWLADENGKYIQTLYVSKSIGKGNFEHAKNSAGKWMPGEIQRPAALPYWGHQRGIVNEFGNYLPSPNQPVIDAYTGATPQSSFVLNVITEKKLSGKYKIMLELNQSWDWNNYWYNDKYPGDSEYKTSSQPALVYSTSINTDNTENEYIMVPVGHSHYSGKDGSLTTNLSSMTTALNIAGRITVTINHTL